MGSGLGSGLLSGWRSVVTEPMASAGTCTISRSRSPHVLTLEIILIFQIPLSSLKNKMRSVE